MQEEQRQVELGAEGEAERLPVGLRGREQEVPLGVEADGVVGGTDRLDQRVVGRLAGVGGRRDEAGHDSEAELWV